MVIPLVIMAVFLKLEIRLKVVHLRYYKLCILKTRSLLVDSISGHLIFIHDE